MEGGNEKQLFSFIILLLVILITISYGFPHIYCMILSIHPLKTSLFKPLQQSESATITIFLKTIQEQNSSVEGTFKDHWSSSLPTAGLTKNPKHINEGIAQMPLQHWQAWGINYLTGKLTSQQRLTQPLLNCSQGPKNNIHSFLQHSGVNPVRPHASRNIQLIQLVPHSFGGHKWKATASPNTVLQFREPGSASSVINNKNWDKKRHLMPPPFCHP